MAGVGVDVADRHRAGGVQQPVIGNADASPGRSPARRGRARRQSCRRAPRWAATSARCQASAHPSGAGLMEPRAATRAWGSARYKAMAALAVESRHPAGSTTTWGTSSLAASQVVTAFEVSGAPKRTASPGPSGRACLPWPAVRPRRAPRPCHHHAGPTGGRPAPGIRSAVASLATASASTGGGPPPPRRRPASPRPGRRPRQPPLGRAPPPLRRRTEWASSAEATALRPGAPASPRRGD